MRGYFRGWYFRCQSARQTVAVIPAEHQFGGRRSCSLQLLTESDAWSAEFPAEALRRESDGVTLAGSRFSAQGIRLNLHTPTLHALGEVTFGALTPLRYDIMGPFCCVPAMECRHSVYSMRHSVSGTLHINGTPYVFDHDVGYWEGDRGRSFPKAYVWTQTSLPEGALMLAAAEIPLGLAHFTGVIGAVLWQGKEYRLATYLGAHVKPAADGSLQVRQGSRCLTVRQLQQGGQPLRAPESGAMSRTIHEHAACRAFYQFQDGGKTLFAYESPNAAFESDRIH